MRKIAILNQKGGVGKTTTVANVSAALAARGKRVLTIDLDPQAHLTIHLGIDPATLENSVYSVLVKGLSVDEAKTKVRDNLYLLGSNIDLVGAESELIDTIGREVVLRDALQGLENDFDFVLIDCPPSLGLLSLNALAAVNEIFIPLQPHFLALQGLGKLLETVSIVNKRINPHLTVEGIIFCMYDARTSLSNEVKNDIEQFLLSSRDKDCPWRGAELVPLQIRRNIKLAEAPSYGQTIFEYEPNCNGAFDYSEISEYFIDKTAYHKKADQPEAINA